MTDVAVAGKVSKFSVITTNAGAGTLAVHIEGPSKVAIVCTELDEGYEFTYTPMAAGNYMLVIKYCSVTIAGCPFKAVVTGRSPSCSYSSIRVFPGKNSDFFLTKILSRPQENICPIAKCFARRSTVVLFQSFCH